MTTFTNISDEVLEPGKPIRSVDALAFRDNDEYLFDASTFKVLDEQIFTASGTWNKPSGFDATDTVVVLAIGGGASGGAYTRPNIAASAGGGAGGGVGIFTLPYGDAPSTVGVTVGSGAAAVTASTGDSEDGENGGTSIFGNFSATGGTGGNIGTASAIGGSGGASRIFPGTSDIDGDNAGFQTGGDGRLGQQTAFRVINYGLTGGGGSAGHNASNVPNTQNFPAMTGALFGDGGAGNVDANAFDGSIPGGGGGGATRTTAGSITSGAGARGEVRVYVVRGRVSGHQLIGVAL